MVDHGDGPLSELQRTHRLDQLAVKDGVHQHEPAHRVQQHSLPAHELLDCFSNAGCEREHGEFNVREGEAQVRLRKSSSLQLRMSTQS